MISEDVYSHNGVVELGVGALKDFVVLVLLVAHGI